MFAIHLCLLLIWKAHSTNSIIYVFLIKKVYISFFSFNLNKWKSKIQNDFKSQYSHYIMRSVNEGKSQFSLRSIVKKLPYKAILLFLLCLVAATYYVLSLLSEVLLNN